MWVGLPVIAVAGLYFGLRDGGAAWKAHNGDGVAGTFVATRAMCKVTGDSCSTIYGTFTPAGGGAERTDVVLYEAPESLENGGQVTAIDTGAPYGVFPTGGGTAYIMYSVFAGGGAVAAIAWILIMVSKFRRRRASAAVAAEPATADPIS